MSTRWLGLCSLAWPVAQAIRILPSEDRGYFGLPLCMAERLRNVATEVYGSVRDTTL
eukprot:CAMPEP_0171198942 /NCGR_PEP_ID=MMETSP0790-20130122/23207_1 /TAXON_ID=2925 /ORGANISM="Alexandrium catenella, Strain OF101" /LENGTH=56 /DNA_ID=CAMNT_0011664271 /DNA_START=49 /DNA_END=216 /DNA_ORIENTATION=+